MLWNSSDRHVLHTLERYGNIPIRTALKIAIFDQYLALGSMTTGASSVLNSFNHAVKFITSDIDNNCDAWVNIVSDGKGSTSFFYELMRRPKRTEQNLIVRTGKSEAEVTNNKRQCLSYCTVEANYRQTGSIVQPVCNSRATCNSMKTTRSSISTHTGRIGFQTSWSWKLVLNWRTDRDRLCRHRIAATWTLGTRSDKPLTMCPIKLLVSIT